MKGYRCSLYNYFYTKTRCQETLFSFIFETVFSSLFASMFCHPILLMSVSPLLLFRQPAWCMIRLAFRIKKSGKYTVKYFPLAFSALHLSYHCSFSVFYGGSGFKNIEAKNVTLFFSRHAFGNLSRPMWCIIRI